MNKKSSKQIKEENPCRRDVWQHVLLGNKSYASDASPGIDASSISDAWQCVPTNKPEQTLGSIIRNIKSCVTKYAHECDIIFSWQGRYHDRIIRNQQEFERIKHYIQTNPQNRESDTFNK